MILGPGTLVHQRYRIVQAIGQGGMGTVYEAVDERLGHTIALKQTRLSGVQADQAFEREARLLARLNHPSLPRVTDYFVETEGQFLVMDYIGGQDLAHLLQQQGGPFAVRQVLDWADQLLDALEYLHRQQPPVIHRDIKPHNMKLGPSDRMMLLDFGLAKGMATTTQQQVSVAGYTPQYAPIEQIQGTGTDHRSDLYALAVTLHHLLTGTAPVNALSRATAHINHQPDPQPAAHVVNPQVPPAVSHVLMQAMAMRSEDRLTDAATMRAALRQAQMQSAYTDETVVSAPAPEAVVANPQPAATPMVQPATQPVGGAVQSKPSKSSLWLWLGGGLAIVVLLVCMLPIFGMAYFLAPMEGEVVPSPPVEAVAVEAGVAPTGQLDTPGRLTAANASDIIEYDRVKAHEGLIMGLAFTPDGKTLASASFDGQVKIWDVERRLLKHNLDGPGGDLHNVTISADGRQVAAGSESGAIGVWDIETGEALYTLQEHRDKVRNLVFAPDGSLLASGSLDKTLRLWDTETGTLLQTIDAHISVWGLAFSPDGQIIAFGDGSSVKMYNLTSNEVVRTLEEAETTIQQVTFSPDGDHLAASFEGSIILWNTFDGSVLATLTKPGVTIKCLAFSPDSQLLASGDDQDMLRLWDMQSKSQLDTNLLHSSTVYSTAFAPDQKLLVAVDGWEMIFWAAEAR
ncbi:MAG: protein kinase [Chloroflexaceae bacterium]|nr:protein kinase [Chloroflexaceae bacterium]